MPTPGVLNATQQPDARLFVSGGSGYSLVSESEIRRDSRGLPRWTKDGGSLLTPSPVDPGPRPTTDNSNAKPGDKIVSWWEWDDANYAWEIANERFHLPADYVPPSLSSATLAQPVITNTEAAVKAGAVADRRAAGIVDGDWKSTGVIADALPFGPDASSIEGRASSAGLGVNLPTPTNQTPMAMPLVQGNGPTRIDGPDTPSRLSLVGQEWTESGAVDGGTGANWGKWALWFGIAGVGLLAYRSLSSSRDG